MTTPQNAAPKGPYIAVHDHVFDLGGPDDTPPLYIFGDCEYPNETANDVAALLNRAYAAGVEAAKQKWQPIETAPMDGTVIWLVTPIPSDGDRPAVFEGFWDESEGMWGDAHNAGFYLHDPVLWQPIVVPPPPPLPSPPEAGG